ncbi:holo-ACP synthase [candidate division WOR-3 bacterium]|nr:holo-ACP synthase [candidate division WOR-3 bacterium]
MFGIGIDLVEVARVRRALERYPERFRDRVFTPSEVAFCEGLADKYPSYAGRFAAKEAFSKALGTGLRGAIGWREIEVLDNERTRPGIAVSGRAAALLGDRKVHLSITHLKDHASAVVLIED